MAKFLVTFEVENNRDVPANNLIYEFFPAILKDNNRLCSSGFQISNSTWILEFGNIATLAEELTEGLILELANKTKLLSRLIYSQLNIFTTKLIVNADHLAFYNVKNGVDDLCEFFSSK